MNHQFPSRRQPPPIWVAPAPQTANQRQEGGTHYRSKAIQPWEAMEAWMTHDAFAGFLTGNVIKYMARHKDKGGVNDLLKARHYLDKLIEIDAQQDDGK